MTISRNERNALADLLLSVGSDAPTMCDGWTAFDLAVHLVVREYRPDASAGMFLPLLSGHLTTVNAKTAARSLEDLVEDYRQGPPWWNPMRWVDGVVNLAENFVHHEDLRRGGEEWAPRMLPEDTRDALWRAVTVASRALIVPKEPAVQLCRTDGAGGEVTIGRGAPGAVIRGEAPEILLWLFGRDKAYGLTFSGETEAITRRSF